jgi:hypothetical protein
MQKSAFDPYSFPCVKASRHGCVSLAELSICSIVIIYSVALKVQSSILSSMVS